MNPQVNLPALDGRDPLGFLAALGVLRLLHERESAVRLSWDPVTAQAVVHGYDGVDRVVDELADMFDSSGDELSPGMPASWPPEEFTAHGAPRQQFAALCEAGPEQWANALWTDLVVDEEQRCRRTLFAAPMGRQTVRSMFEHPHAVVRAAAPKLLAEALVGWRRHPGFTGENLDIRALQEAAESPDGQSSPAGVPGATWLAWAAMPFFRLTGDRERLQSVGWTVSSRPKRIALSWPLWSRPLDVAAVAVLLDHPAISRAASRPGRATTESTRSLARARALGAFAVVTAVRRLTTAAKSDGILVTETVRAVG